MKNRFKILVFVSLFLSFTINCKEKESRDLCLNSFSIQDPAKSHRKVLFIGLDGFRSDALMQSNAPFLFALANNGQTFFNQEHKTEFYTSSGPNWTSITNGVHHNKHLVVDNLFTDYDHEDYPHFFKYIENANPSLKTASSIFWIPINIHLTRDYADYTFGTIVSDSVVHHSALDLLENQNPINPDVLFLHYDNLDHNGHAHGFHSSIPEYSAAITRTDNYMMELYNVISAKRANGEDWLIIIVSDHGGEGQDHSDSYDPMTNQTILFLDHPSLNFNTSIGSSQVDLVPTVFDFLGISSESFDCKKDGVSLILD